MGGLLAGQVALITGAGRGVGRAVTLALADAGAVVAAVSRSHDQLQETVELVASAGGRAIAIVADVTDPQAVDRMAQRAAGELGSVGILVNNAGLARSIGPVWEVEPEEWWRDVETNLRGPFLRARAVLPGMLARRARADHQRGERLRTPPISLYLRIRQFKGWLTTANRHFGSGTCSRSERSERLRR
jgi:NAD(P)-dependent dehydrogenase (short-subunit alcohol dehydrogenase family)